MTAYNRTKVLVALSLWALAAPSVRAFAPSISRTASHASPAIQMNMDDSEWYSPPPPPPKTVVPANSKALQTSLFTHEDLSSFLHDQNDERLVIIKYYASWCRTCAKVSRKMDLLAAQHADWVSQSDGHSVTKQGNVRIASVEYMAGRELCVGIDKLPTIRMFLPGPNGVLEQVQEFSCPPSQFQHLTDLVKGYIQQQKLRKEEEELSEALTRGHAMIQNSLQAAELATTAAASTDVIAAANPGGRRARLWKRLQRSN